MTTRRPRRLKGQFPRWLLDEMAARHRDWQLQCAAVSAAYERWSNARGSERGLTYHAYRAALELEEQACRVYADRVARLRSELARGSEPLAPSERGAMSVA